MVLVSSLYFLFQENQPPTMIPCTTARNLYKYVFSANPSVANYLQFANLSQTNLSSFTVTMWVKPKNVTASNKISLLTYKTMLMSGCPAWSISLTNSQTVLVKVKGGISTFYADYTSDRYIHVGVTWSIASNRIQLFINGHLNGARNLTMDQIQPVMGHGDFYVGQTYFRELSQREGCAVDTFSTLKGEVSQVYVWDRELSGTSIANAMWLKAPCEGRILDWDTSSSKYNGTIQISTVSMEDFLAL